jgi:hypothetical protein
MNRRCFGGEFTLSMASLHDGLGTLLTTCRGTRRSCSMYLSLSYSSHDVHNEASGLVEDQYLRSMTI